MAIAEIEYVCSECGQTATRRVKKYNSREAREYEEWFKSLPEHICPDCYAKHRHEDQLKELNEVLKDYPLPKIVGKSEKQIKYADDCRMKVLRDNIESIKKALTVYDPEKGWANNALMNAVRKALPEVRESELLTVIFKSHAFFYLVETEARYLIDGPMILDNLARCDSIRQKMKELHKEMKEKGELK